MQHSLFSLAAIAMIPADRDLSRRPRRPAPWLVAPVLLLCCLMGWNGVAQAQAQPATPVPSPSPAQPAAPPVQRTAPTQSAPAQPATPAQPTPAQPAPAQPAAPPELTNLMAQIDAAANQRNLAALMAFYSPNFTNSDGLNYTTLQETLQQLWQRYPNLTYQTQINSWRSEGNATIVETTTTITGTQETAGRSLNLSSTITAQQRLEGQQIVSQAILRERSQVSSGPTPPTVEVSLPERVQVGRPFDFDAVVTEPLGDRVLLGAVLEEPIQAAGYLNTAPINLEVLSAGGVFKIGRAPINPGNRWISAIIVRDDGMIAVTQRLRVAPRNPGNPAPTPRSTTPPADGANPAPRNTTTPEDDANPALNGAPATPGSPPATPQP